jgi:aminobenzoyl-glutamate utilization protein B
MTDGPSGNEDEVWRRVEARREAFFALSDRVWATPELNYQEHRSSAEHALMLEREGFRVTAEVAGIPTAVVGEAGEGGPVIAILGEFDALPGLSQEAGVAEPRPVEPGGNGHACGHNLLGAGALLAAAAVKDWLEATGVPGRVRYYGCPAEEGGSAKGFMVRAGAFADVDAAISWHPAAFASVTPPVSLACTEVEFTFTGRSAHAAVAPHLGRSALDAVELMSVGVNYMREHMPGTARVHAAIVDTGGVAPNVVQARAVVRYLVRGKDLAEMGAVLARVRRIADGAALMTETAVRSQVLSGDANLLGNAPLEALMAGQLARLGPPPFDDADRRFAAHIQATLSPGDVAAAFARAEVEPREGLALCDRIATPAGDPMIAGSTDVGTVSWVVPTVQMRGATHAIGTPGHSWQVVAQGKAPAAHKGMEHAAKAMAGVAAELFRDPALVGRAKADLGARLADKPFVNPIPDDVEPPLAMAAQR